jgi:hypothetical protein
MRKIFVFCFCIVFGLSACGAKTPKTLSGVYEAEEEGMIITAFEFDNTGTGKMQGGMLGFSTTVPFTYKIQGNKVIVSVPGGDQQLEIRDSKTLVLLGYLYDGQVFRKK